MTDMARAEKSDTLAFDYVDRIENVVDPSDLMGMFSDALSEFGFTSFLVTRLPHQTAAFAQHTILNGWPEAWYRRYSEKQYYNVDAVAINGRQSVDPFYWSDVVPKPDNKAISLQIMNEAGECGLTDGLLVPIYGANGEQSCITMAGKDIDRRSRTKQALHLMAMFTHHQAIKLHERGKCKAVSSAMHLTLRERECLQWAARGKTDWETSRILSISNNTVSAHIAKATKKLTAANRTEAVAKAIVYRQIAL
jgi:LuxR family transcriptional regulator, quorum-sensing system regulator BjaR1